MPNRYQMVSLTNEGEVLDCALELTDQDYTILLPMLENTDHTFIFIDRVKKEFLTTDIDGLRVSINIVASRDNENVIETNLNQIKQWPDQRPQKVQA